MSAQAEEFAGQLLEKTQAGKLKWQFVPDPKAEMYKSDAEGGIAFWIKRNAQGDDKILTFQLTESGRVALSDSENNLTDFTTSITQEQIPTLIDFGAESRLRKPNESKIKRFRLYSDLFYAAREIAEGKDQAIEKAQQFLSRLA